MPALNQFFQIKRQTFPGEVRETLLDKIARVEIKEWSKSLALRNIFVQYAFLIHQQTGTYSTVDKPVVTRCQKFNLL
jgi:hypothetical protein